MSASGHALIVVDYQNDFTPPSGALAVPEGDTIAPRINELMHSGEYDLVVATRDWHPPDHGSFTDQGGIWPVHCVQDTEGAQLHPGLDAAAVDVIVDKGQPHDTDGYSGFDGTNLAELLRERGITASPSSASPPTTASSTRLSRRCRRASPCSSTPAPFAASRSSRETPSVRWPRFGPRARTSPRPCRRGPPAGGAAREHRRRAGARGRAHGAARPVRPSRQAADAWANIPLPIGWGQTISQPLVVARMCELLALRSGDRVLDVGTGSGIPRRPALRLCEHVYSVELYPALSDRAGRCLAAAGIENVTLAVGDGCAGLPEHAPYDAINVAAAARREIPQALVDQLGEGGRLVAPVEDRDQRLVLLLRSGGTLVSTTLDRVRFVPLLSSQD